MIEVLEAGFLTTVQDSGRPRAMAWGVPAGGAMDRFALAAANRITGSHPEAAQLESYGPGIRCRADCELVVTGAGCGYQLTVEDRIYPLWMSVLVSPGQSFGLSGLPDSGWGILAFSGGIAVPRVLGSCSTNLSSGWGGYKGRKLEAGDTLETGDAPDVHQLAGRSIPADFLPAYGQTSAIEVVLPEGQDDRGDEMLTGLFSNTYTISETSSRMGYRLRGTTIKSGQTPDILSEGTVFGTIQLPGNGQPLVLMSDAQPTGGYRKLGVVASASLPVLVQSSFETTEIRFQPCDVETARLKWLRLAGRIKRLTWDENGDAQIDFQKV